MVNLKNYFELDFPETATVKFELKAIEKSNHNNEVDLYAQAHIDFTSHVKFCSFYIPKNQNVTLFEMCKAALAYSRDVLALRGGIELRLPKAHAAWTGQGITIRHGEYLDIDLVPLEDDKYSVADFSLALPVYIYAEKDLSQEDKLKILELGRRYNVIVKLKGLNYAMKR